MKLLKIIALSFCVVFIQSCDEGEDENNKVFNTTDLLGTWKMTALSYTGTSTTTYRGRTYTAEFDGFAKDIDAVLEFTQNPNEYISSGSYTLVLTITSNSFYEKSEIYSDELFDNGEWLKNENQLTLSISNEGSQALEVLNITDSELSLQEVEIFTEEDEDVDGEAHIKIIYSFSK